MRVFVLCISLAAFCGGVAHAQVSGLTLPPVDHPLIIRYEEQCVGSIVRNASGCAALRTQIIAEFPPQSSVAMLKYIAAATPMATEADARLHLPQWGALAYLPGRIYSYDSPEPFGGMFYNSSRGSPMSILTRWNIPGVMMTRYWVDAFGLPRVIDTITKSGGNDRFTVNRIWVRESSSELLEATFSKETIQEFGRNYTFDDYEFVKDNITQKRKRITSDEGYTVQEVPDWSRVLDFNAAVLANKERAIREAAQEAKEQRRSAAMGNVLLGLQVAGNELATRNRERVQANTTISQGQGPKLDNGPTSGGRTGGIASPSSKNAGEPLQFFYRVGMAPNDGETRNPNCVSNVVTLSETVSFGASGSEGRAAALTDLYRDTFIAKCKQLGRVMGPGDAIYNRRDGSFQPGARANDRRVELP